MITKTSIEEYAELRDERCKEVFAMRDKLIEEKLTLIEAVLAACFDMLAKFEPLPLDKTQWTSHLLENEEIYGLMERIIDTTSRRSIGNQVLSFFFGGAVNAVFDSLSGLNYARLSRKEKQGFIEGFLLVGLWKEAK